jgi:bifunctional non-homologous end joining protein LigD
MTSGGKGYHIHVPVAPLYSWDEIKAFAETVSKKLEEDFPKLYTTSMSPARRKGKIFIDFLRNSRGHTAIAPYSLRARARATIAAPIPWKDLRTSAPDQFGLKDVRKLLGRRDPWAGLQKLRQKLSLFE